MKYFSVVVLFVVMYAVACLTAEDSLAVADEKKTDKRGIYGFGYGGYGGHGLYGHGHALGGHFGGHYGHAIGLPAYSGYSLHTPISGHGFYPYHGGFYHGFH